MATELRIAPAGQKPSGTVGARPRCARADPVHRRDTSRLGAALASAGGATAEPGLSREQGKSWIVGGDNWISGRGHLELVGGLQSREVVGFALVVGTNVVRRREGPAASHPKRHCEEGCRAEFVRGECWRAGRRAGEGGERVGWGEVEKAWEGEIR